MESKKAEEYIMKHRRSSMPNESMGVTYYDAKEAVEIAEKELKEKTIEAHRLGCPFKCHNLCGREVINKGDIYHACEGNCEYMQKFKELTNK